MQATNLFYAVAVVAMPLTACAGEVHSAFDAAEDLSRFVFAAAPVYEDGMPGYRDAFVTWGYIYPAGRLDGDIEGTLEWTCEGFFVGGGVATSYPIPQDDTELDPGFPVGPMPSEGVRLAA